MNFSFVPDIYAASEPILASGQDYGFAEMLKVAIALIVMVAGIASIIFIIWGGLMIILSGGKDDKVKPAINSIRYAVIGIVVIVVAVFVAPKAAEMLGVGQYEYLSPENIFETINSIANKFFGGGSGGSSSSF